IFLPKIERRTARDFGKYSSIGSGSERMIDDIVLTKVESIERCIRQILDTRLDDFIQFTTEIIRSLSNNESTNR
ncbi:MAG TPA: hypothetical protein PLD70_12345, partial [Thermotogota bacterium]|nr:hypothetical protein [Thermotogota bacterium]